MKEMTIDFGNEKTINIEEHKKDVVITMSKDMIPNIKFIFEDSGIPGIVGPDIYMDAKSVVEKHLKECEKIWN